MSSEVTANLVEIFSSVQGEGPWLGCSTLFIRFGRCDLRCRWCDSAHTWKPAERCRLHAFAGRGERLIENPIGLERLIALVREFAPERHRFLSLTGGEPLLQPEAVGSLARAIRPGGPRILLETHGLAAAALESVIDAVDVVSMDWKLASEVQREGRAHGRDAFDAEHAAFLRVALRAPERVVKVVVTPSTREAELDAMAAAIGEIDAATPVVLQPVTPIGAIREAVPADQLLAWLARLEARLPDVRLIPQTHPQLALP